MHDGAPYHGLKVVLKYLWKSKVEVLVWPGNSPDLNPIESLQSYTKDKVAEKQPSSAKEFVTAIKEVWVKEISTEYCALLVKKYAQPSCCNSAKERWTHKILKTTFLLDKK